MWQQRVADGKWGLGSTLMEREGQRERDSDREEVTIKSTVVKLTKWNESECVF